MPIHSITWPIAILTYFLFSFTLLKPSHGLKTVTAKKEKGFLPIRGTESEVAGMISATNNMKTVSDSSTVMPGESQD